MATAEKRWFEMDTVNWGTSLLPDLPRNAATARRVCTVGDLVRSSLIPAVIWARINEEYFTECPVTPRKNRYFGTGLTSIWRERSLPKTMNSRAVSCQLLSITLRLGKVTRYLQIRYSWQLCKRETGLALQCDILIKSGRISRDSNGNVRSPPEVTSKTHFRRPLSHSYLDKHFRFHTR